MGIAARDPVGCRKKHSGQPAGQFASAWVGFVDDVPLVIGVFLTLLMGARVALLLTDVFGAGLPKPPTRAWP